MNEKRKDMKTFIVADSGGTGTEWCYVNEQGTKSFFATRSYHPIHWTADFFKEEQEFWTNQPDLLKGQLNFFGAGCLNNDHAQKLSAFFKSIGFEDVSVRSDLHGASFALLQEESGSFGILGTGSVAAEIVDGQLKNVTGGLGYLLGDEGSGYYFGKMLIKSLLTSELEDGLSKLLLDKLGGKAAIMEAVYGKDSRAFLSQLAKSTVNYPYESIRHIHEINIELFFESIQGKLNLANGISLVGSYAYAKRELIAEIGGRMGVKVELIIEKPIDQLTEYVLKHAK